MKLKKKIIKKYILLVTAIGISIDLLDKLITFITKHL